MKKDLIKEIDETKEIISRKYKVNMFTGDYDKAKIYSDVYLALESLKKPLLQYLNTQQAEKEEEYVYIKVNKPTFALIVAKTIGKAIVAYEDNVEETTDNFQFSKLTRSEFLNRIEKIVLSPGNEEIRTADIINELEDIEHELSVSGFNEGYVIAIEDDFVECDY